MKQYIDIHHHNRHMDTHKAVALPDDIWTVTNFHTDFEQSHTMQPCSIGLHPWHLDNHAQELQRIAEIIPLPHVVAIGECGLDTVCTTPMDIQKHVFQQQIALANKAGKPLIIHCVRAFPETIALLKQAQVPVIFHGFQKNPALAKELTSHGFYLSFGAALTENKKNAIDSLSLIATDRFFLETDDSPVSIHHIYEAAAAVRQLSKDALVLQIQQNYKTVFGI